MKVFMSVIWKRIKQDFRKFAFSRCLSCDDGRLRSEFIDMNWDKVVYKCDRCGERFI